MKLFIGSKFYGHDTSVFIINPDEKDIFAISTERITRYKHDYLYPIQVIEKYLQEKNIDTILVDEIYVGLPFLYNCKARGNWDKISSSFNKIEVLFRKIFQLRYINEVQTKKNTFKNYNKQLF